MVAPTFKDRVQETSTFTGTTSPITLLGAVSGYQSFATAFPSATTLVNYTITVTGGSDWEVGQGTYTLSGTTLSRTTIYDSSNSGSIVTFGAGTKNVFCDAPATNITSGFVGNTVTLKGNPTGATAIVSDVTLGSTLNFVSTALQTKALTGDITAAANSFVTTVANIQGTVVGGTTGTGNVVFSASPTFTGTIIAAALSLSGSLTTPTILPVSVSLAIGAAAGAESLRVNTVASAVNRIEAYGATTTNAVLLNAAGSDTNVTMQIHSKAAGLLSLGTGSGIQVNITDTASVANTLQLTGAASSGNASINVSANNLLFGSGSALSTSATTGFILTPSMAGTPTGSVVGAGSGKTPIVIDTTDFRVWANDGTNWFQAGMGLIPNVPFSPNITQTAGTTATGSLVALIAAIASGKVASVTSLVASNITTGTNSSVTVQWLDSSASTNTYLAFAIPVLVNSAVELLYKPKILHVSDTLSVLAANTSTINVTATWELLNVAVDNLGSMGSPNVPATLTTIFTSAGTTGSFIESILIANRDAGSGTSAGHWITIQGQFVTSSVTFYDVCFELLVPVNSSIELVMNRMFVPTGNVIQAQASDANTLDVTIAFRQV